MSLNSEGASIKRPDYKPSIISAVMGTYALLGGLTTLVGWFADIPRLTDWQNKGISMMPNAAVCASSAGLALIVLVVSRARMPVRVLGLLPALIGALTLFQYLSGINLGIDTMLVFREWGQNATVVPGRMGPPGSVSWTIIGFALLLTTGTPRMRRAAVKCALLTTSIGMLSLVGYLFGAEPLFTIPRLTTIALQTATIILGVALGIITALRDHQPMKTILADTTAGVLARRALPFVILLPLLLGWLRLRGQQAGFYDLTFGTAVRTSIEVALLVAVLWWALAKVNAKEDALRQSEQRLRLFIEHAPAAIAMFDRQMRYLAVSQRWKQDYQLADEVLGRSHYALFPEMPERWKEIHRRGLAGETLKAENDSFVRADGSVQWIKWEVRPWHSENRNVAGLLIAAEDITPRVLAQQSLRESEERLRLAQQVALVGTFEWNIQTGMNVWTPELEAIYGLPPGEFAGTQQAWENLIYKEDRSRTIQRVNEAMKTGSFAAEWRIVRPDGSLRWVAGRASLFKDNAGKPLRLLGVNIDITERKQAEDQLREREAVLRTVTNEARVGLVMVNSERRYLFANQTYADILGLPSADIVGKRVSEVLHHLYDQIEPRLDEAFSGVRVQYELRLPSHGQSRDERFYEVVYEPRTQDIPDPYVVVVIVDITERRKLQETLERAVAERTSELRETIGELEAYSYSISHDMRAPLRAMQAFSQVLLTDHRDQLNTVGKGYLDRIMNSSARLDKLIQDVLSYSRVARAELKLEPISLDRLVKDLIQEYPTVQAAQIAVADSLGTVLAAEALLAQAISNLLTNAAKFVKPGDKPRIKIWSEEASSPATKSKSIRLFIQDNGIGIPRENQDRIFGIFNRVHSEKEYDGTGIGLSIVKKAVERMNGQVGLTSDVGQGSTFWLELPKA